MTTYKKGGFSLIELLVALSILAVVAAIIVPRFLNVRSQAAATTSQAQQQELQSDIQKWVSLGGTGGSGDNNAGDFLGLLTETASGTPPTRTAVGALGDSSGNFGSTSVSLSLSNNVATTSLATVATAYAGSQSLITAVPQGFYWAAAGNAYYSDGAGSLYQILVNGSDGNVEFQAAANGVSTTNIGNNN
jgi:prepilin-type N-terminal cleavage/methylation domain-containing protein